MARSRGAPARASRSRSSSPPPRSSYSSAPQQPAPPRPAAAAPPPAPAPPQQGYLPQQYAPRGGGMGSGLLGAMATGAAVGTGSAIAHRAVDSMLGPRYAHEAPAQQETAPAAAPYGGQQAAPAEAACSFEMKGFSDCMLRSGGDMEACRAYFDAMQRCKAAPAGYGQYQ